ncbi:MAG: exosome catalytic subunit dis3 [Watsoniomyces obsoletus]|nr:MAG: exosome catalytic subunit dis3 [Watsoniomyces obsoletus]
MHLIARTERARLSSQSAGIGPACPRAPAGPYRAADQQTDLAPKTTKRRQSDQRRATEDPPGGNPIPTDKISTGPPRTRSHAARVEDSESGPTTENQPASPRGPADDTPTVSDPDDPPIEPIGPLPNTDDSETPLQPRRATGGMTEEEQQALTYAEEAKAMRARIAAAKHRKLMAEMEEELRMVEQPGPLQGPATGERRPGSDTGDAAIPPAKRTGDIAEESKFRVVDPEAYRSRSQREYTKFIRQCEQVFAIRPTTYEADRQKILMATSHVQGDPADAWWRREQEQGLEGVTWEDFKAFLRNALLPETLRRTDVHHRYRNAKQGPNQSVSAFVAFLDELEQYMQPYTEVQRAQTLLDGLRPYLSRKIKERANVPQTRSAIVRPRASEVLLRQCDQLTAPE